MFSARSADFPGIHSHFKENTDRPLIPTLGEERQVDFCQFKANLAYKSRSRTAGVVTVQSGGGRSYRG